MDATERVGPAGSRVFDARFETRGGTVQKLEMEEIRKARVLMLKERVRGRNLYLVACTS